MPSPGFIYFAMQGLRGPVKIGRATNVRRRIASLQTGSCDLIYLIGWLESTDAERDEKELHRHFRAYLIRGEWFAPALPLLQFVFRLETCDPAYFEDGDDAVI